jgi:pimeloyl-ACP methyl ester carboxylesterase
MAQATRSVMLPHGITLPYVEQGDPAGVPVLLLHGITDSWRSFERVLPPLPNSIRAIAVSQRGHGDADRPVSGYRPQDFASDLAGLAESLDLGPAVVVGHSMGASIAQRFAIDHPGRTRGLALVGSLPTWKDHPDFVGLWDSVVSTLTDPVDPAFVREFQGSTTPMSRTDLRATYGGFDLGFGVFLALCAFRREWIRAGLAAMAIALAGFAGGRTYGMIVDGCPSPFMPSLAALEASGSILAFLVYRKASKER